MFRKILIIAMFATAAGYCFAAHSMSQVVTSEVYYDTERAVIENQSTQRAFPPAIPTWPLAGSDADVDVACEGGACTGAAKNTNAAAAADDNIRIVSKIGADLVVENNINLGARGNFGGWSGGANMVHGNAAPAGFVDECAGAEMPLMRREMLEDDGGEILSVSRSNRQKCNKSGDGYAAFAARMGMTLPDGVTVTESETEIAVNESADAEAPKELLDQVRSWVVASGQTLREILQNWCDKEGWDLVWATSREYPIEASAVFKGRFVDVASALVRNFGRATPVPYAKFYKGNRVLVISTTEE
ncbi:hypothetical protein HDR63_02950 [bacterium]|nr:hypothetical protein [bacterium]